MYRNSEIAFGELDFDGKGYVTENAFLESNLIKQRIKYPQELIKLYFREYNLFP